MSTDHRSDTDLLLAYGRDGDETAFETLAARHVDMIFAVSLRRSNNRQLAEEATQNVLIVLSMKARKLSASESNLTGWLHKSTRFEVAKLQRREHRIHKREQAYASETMNHYAQEEDQEFHRLYPLLDQAIDNLRTPDREVIVRRYLEGQSFGRIAEALGISEDAAQKRTSRAFDQLNRFFKRKAGVTVTAAAMAAGISQHCAEAAPAACLNIAGKTVSTGLTSILTSATITTMSMTKISTIAAAIVVLGGAIVFISNKKEDSQEIVSTPLLSEVANAPASSDAPVSPVADDTSNEISDSYSPNEELAKLEAKNPHPGKAEFIRRLSVKHDRLLKDLTAELGLNPEQAASLKALLDTRLKTFGEALDMSDGEMAMLTKAGGIIRGVGLRDEMTIILSGEQLAAFDKREAEAWQSQVESHAYIELSKITPALDLSEDQKDRAFKLLQSSSEQHLKESADARAMMGMLSGQSPVQVEIGNLEEAAFFHKAFDGANPMKADSPEFIKEITDIVGRQIQKDVELLAPVLDERQTQRYRDHLYQKSLLPTLGIKFPKPE